ncbi:hypothetical protein [Agromyces sp. SYSU T00194]|uniref:hypothetical protein n=1 Tax=Agromyces chitinivorans TaxID=3158560 RepID=UPI003390E727
MDRRSARAARRDDLSGAGPTLGDRPIARFPGATGAFGLLGEVLLVGVLVAVASLPLVTLPAAFAAGVGHLRRYLNAEDSRIAGFWRDLRDSLRGGVVVGLVAALVAALLVSDLALVATGALPGGDLIGVVGWIGLVALALVLCIAAGEWTRSGGWRAAVRAVPGYVRTDVRGALYLVCAVGFVGVMAWTLVPLVVPALGCAVLAIVAVPERPRRDDDDQ